MNKTTSICAERSASLTRLVEDCSFPDVVITNRSILYNRQWPYGLFIKACICMRVADRLPPTISIMSADNSMVLNMASLPFSHFTLRLGTRAVRPLLRLFFGHLTMIGNPSVLAWRPSRTNCIGSLKQCQLRWMRNVHPCPLLETQRLLKVSMVAMLCSLVASGLERFSKRSA